MNVISDLLIGFKQMKYHIRVIIPKFKMVLKYFNFCLILRINLRLKILSFLYRNHEMFWKRLFKRFYCVVLRMNDYIKFKVALLLK